MFEFMGKEINAILGAQTILIWTYNNVLHVLMYAFSWNGGNIVKQNMQMAMNGEKTKEQVMVNLF